MFRSRAGARKRSHRGVARALEKGSLSGRESTNEQRAWGEIDHCKPEVQCGFRHSGSLMNFAEIWAHRETSQRANERESFCRVPFAPSLGASDCTRVWTATVTPGRGRELAIFDAFAPSNH
jgi:hypothetical protein